MEVFRTFAYQIDASAAGFVNAGISNLDQKQDNSSLADVARSDCNDYVMPRRREEIFASLVGNLRSRMREDKSQALEKFDRNTNISAEKTIV